MKGRLQSEQVDICGSAVKLRATLLRNWTRMTSLIYCTIEQNAFLHNGPTVLAMH